MLQASPPFERQHPAEQLSEKRRMSRRHTNFWRSLWKTSCSPQLVKSDRYAGAEPWRDDHQRGVKYAIFQSVIILSQALGRTGARKRPLARDLLMLSQVMSADMSRTIG